MVYARAWHRIHTVRCAGRLRARASWRHAPPTGKTHRPPRHLPHRPRSSPMRESCLRGGSAEVRTPLCRSRAGAGGSPSASRGSITRDGSRPASGQFALFGSSSTILGVLAGVKGDPLPWLRLELLAEGGANSVSGAGTELFSSSLSGDNAVLPYLGGRAGVSALLGHSRRFVLGWWVSGGDDVGQVTIHPVIQSCFLMCSQTAETFTIGGPSWSTGLRIGGELSRW